MEKMKQSEKKALNIKNAEIFDLNYTPNKIYVRDELGEVAEQIGDYLSMNVQNHILVYGSKGSGKTVSILSMIKSFEELDRDMKSFYISVREFSTSYKIYQKISGITKRGLSISDARKEAMEKMKEKTILVLDEVDFLKDLDVLYHICRTTKSNLVLLTQKIHWYKEIRDESIKSSMQPTQILFKEYNSNEIYEILKMRAENGLYKWREEALMLMSALVTRDYNSDARIGIKALFKLGIKNSWEDDRIYEGLKEASKEVEGETVQNLRDMDLIILHSLIKYNETNKAYSYALKSLDNYKGCSVSKTHFFRIINYLQNIGLLSLIKKRIGRYYTSEVQILLSDPTIVKREIQIRMEA
jgi:cell division control protein 6